MATKDESEALYDLDNLPPTENTARARIETPGIIHNLKPKVEMVTGKYKDKARAGEMWTGFQLTLTDEDNLEISEIYFAPPSTVDEVSDKFKQKKFELSDGRMVETMTATKAETLKILNNEFASYLIDLGTAFGYMQKEIKEMFVKNAKGGFAALGKVFCEKFKPSDSRRISAKILFNNNTKKETSFLKIHGSYPVYYPYGNDLFDSYSNGRPTELKLTKWESENGMVKKYTGNTSSDAPTADGKTVHKKYQSKTADSKGSEIQEDVEDAF